MTSKNDKSAIFLNAWKFLTVYTDREAEPEAEHVFHPVRKWRFDWAWPDKKVAVEVEGNAWSVRGGGRHMQDSDLDKYNQAALLGWRVFRFSPSMLTNDPVGCVEIVKKALRQ